LARSGSGQGGRFVQPVIDLDNAAQQLRADAEAPAGSLVEEIIGGVLAESAVWKTEVIVP